MNTENIRNYVFNANSYITTTPSIRVDLERISAEELVTQQTNYMEKAQAYSNNFTTILKNRDYVQTMFMYDLSAEKKYLTKQGINKAENKINLHAKTDNIFAIAQENYGFSSSNNVSNIITNVEKLYNELVLADDATSSAFTEDYATEDSVYDSKAIALTFGDNEDLIFLNTIPNVVGTTRQIFANYTSELDESSTYINTLQYTAEYVTNYAISENATANVWVIKNTSGTIEYYTTSDILDSEATIEWTAVVGA